VAISITRRAIGNGGSRYALVESDDPDEIPISGSKRSRFPNGVSYGCERFSTIAMVPAVADITRARPGFPLLLELQTAFD